MYFTFKYIVANVNCDTGMGRQLKVHLRNRQTIRRLFHLRIKKLIDDLDLFHVKKDQSLDRDLDLNLEPELDLDLDHGLGLGQDLIHVEG